jgi:FkbM family methyltransferase
MARRHFQLATNVLISLGKYLNHYGVAGIPTYFWHRVRTRVGRKGALVKVHAAADPDPYYLRMGSSDLAVFYQIFIAGEYDVENLWFFKDLQRKCAAIRDHGGVPVIVDAGANIGIASRRLLAMFPGAQVVAIEPDPENAALAAVNTRNTPAIHVIEKALWSRRALVGVDNPTAESWAFRFSERPAGDRDAIEAITLDDAVASVDRGQLLLVKMDIEGAERTVLAGEGAWWDSRPVLIMEPHDRMEGLSGSARGLLVRPEYRDGSIMIIGENLIFVPLPAEPALRAAAQ